MHDCRGVPPWHDPDRSAGALRQVSPPIWLDTRADAAQCRRGRRVLTGPACFVWCERLEAPASRKPRNNPMQRATEVGSSGDGGFGEIRKTTPCSRAPEDQVIRSAEQPHAKAVATQDRGRGNPKNNPHAVRLPGARESKTAEQPQDLWTGRSNDPSSWGGQGRATTGCAPGAWSQERRTGVAAKNPKSTPCSRMQPLFSAFPHESVCARGPRGQRASCPDGPKDRVRHPPRSPPTLPLAAPAARPRGEPPHVRDANATPGPVFSFTLWRGSHGPSEGGHVYKVCAESRWVAPVPPRFRLR